MFAQTRKTLAALSAALVLQAPSEQLSGAEATSTTSRSADPTVPSLTTTSNTPASTVTNTFVTKSATALVLPKKVEIKGARRALIVGVQDARIGDQNLVKLSGSPIDAVRMRDQLKASSYHTTLMCDSGTNQVPTAKAFRAQLANFTASAKTSDLILFYFSGHGTMLHGTPVLFFKDDSVSLHEIKMAMRNSKAIARVMFIDACREEPGFRTESREVTDLHVVLSCRPDETSLGRENGTSIFTEVLLNAFQSCQGDRVPNGELDLNEIIEFLDDKVPAYADRVKPGHSQNPSRTVVEARAINPVIGSCLVTPPIMTSTPTTFEPQIVAYAEPVTEVGRNDLVLAAAEVGVRHFPERAVLEPLLPLSEGVFANLTLSRAGIGMVVSETVSLNELFESPAQQTYLDLQVTPAQMQSHIGPPLSESAIRTRQIARLTQSTNAAENLFETDRSIARTLENRLQGFTSVQLEKVLGKPDTISGIVPAAPPRLESASVQVPPAGSILTYSNTPVADTDLKLHIINGKVKSVVIKERDR